MFAKSSGKVSVDLQPTGRIIMLRIIPALITAHSSQGKTLPKAIVDLRIPRTFSPIAAYSISFNKLSTNNSGWAPRSGKFEKLEGFQFKLSTQLLDLPRVGKFGDANWLISL